MQASDLKITFIGAGNMATAIIGGLISKGFDNTNILVSAPSNKNLLPLKEKYSVATTNNNNNAVVDSNVIILSVKPQMMKNVCEPLAAHINKNALIISVAAGITCDTLKQWLNDDFPIIRCMPNTPAQIQEGVSGLFANSLVQKHHKNTAEEILGAVGITQWVEDESLINSIIAVAGSAPAYFFLFIEAMIEAAIEQGLSAEDATRMATQTAYGSAKLALSTGENIKQLRHKVTSPNGTTEQAILSFENNGLRQIVREAMSACSKRAKEIELQSSELK